MSNDEKCLSALVEDAPVAATAPTTYYIYGCCVGPLGNAEIQVNNIEIMGDQTVYIIQDGSHTKMVQWPSNVAKYYTGTVDNFNTENWDTYNLQPSGNYLLKPTPPAPDAAAAPVEDTPAAPVEDAPAAAVADTLAAPEDAPAAPAALEDVPAAAPVEDTPAAAPVEDTPAAPVEDAPAAPAALEDTPAAALEDTPAAALEDTPAAADVAAPAAADVAAACERAQLLYSRIPSTEDAPFFVAAAPVENDASRSAKRTAEGLKHAQRGSGMGAMRGMGQRIMNKLCFQ